MRYLLRITPLTDAGLPEPPESVLRAMEAYMGAFLTASGIHAAITIEPHGPCLTIGAPEPKEDE